MQRYFIENRQINDDLAVITDGDYHHIKHVMRQKIGDHLILNTYDGDVFLGEIKGFDTDKVHIKLIEKRPSKPLSYHLDLALSLTKRDAFEWAIKKATELGVQGIIPLESEHSLIKIKDAEKKLKRYFSLAKESAEQSERSTLPHIYGFSSIQDINLLAYDHLFVAYAREEGRHHLYDELRKIQAKEKSLVLIGPEGGFSKSEIDLLISKGFRTISLGSTILRAETAAMYVAAAFRLILGGSE